MKKNIWILNHYATNQYFNKGGRHYWFAEALKKQGYKATIICSNTRHNNAGSVEVNKHELSKVIHENAIPYIFIKSSQYTDNGFGRIKNMYSFYRNTIKEYRSIINKVGRPDVILASSVHPLTLVAGLKIAKKLGVPCICE